MRAKYGLSRLTIQSASTVRGSEVPSGQDGSTPQRNRAETIRSVPGMKISRSEPRRGSVGMPPNRCGTEEKKAANCQKSSFFHLAKGWSWHWAQPTCTPRKIREVAAARFSGLFSLAE